MRKLFILIALLGIFGLSYGASKKLETNGALIIQSDFGLKDGAVSEMQGVAFGVSKDLKIFNLTHEIPPYNIWEAAYRLYQSAPYWPKGSVFVSIVDPGVGTSRKSIVLKTKNGLFFVSPDNGTLSLVAEKLGIEEVREIDERINRLKNSQDSHTFHGRDVYSYTGARLASGTISFEQVGKSLGKNLLKLEYQKPDLNDGVLKGNIPILDVAYGNVWTNIPKDLFDKFNLKIGKNACVHIYEEVHGQKVSRFNGALPYANSFGDVPEGKNLLFLNSLLNVSFAVNMGDFAKVYGIGSGQNWSVEITKCQAKNP
ncbi:MAG: S-adenosyl-l-methionine hydroxide adenosyltransferase family protein [Helicobacter sp.]|nr:S-adenosyl-l-methionine hydroxide adenosyltransferase family protein [Helicobacter sp.]